MSDRLAIFSDLDGTLLDAASYSHQAAEPALEALRERGIPLVLCTSKTRAEVQAIRRELGNGDPFIVENGGAILIPGGYFPFPVQAHKRQGRYLVIELGVPYSRVAAVLGRAARVSACQVRSFRNMTVAELARRCRMGLASAARAKQREYDEPFEVLSESPALISSLLRRIEQEGLTWTHGGRFYHIRGRHNKGQGVKILTGLLRRRHPDTVTVGIGDGPNDISLLGAVDVPIVIPSRRGRSVPPLPARVPVAAHAGPRGWNEAVLRLVQNDYPAQVC